ncbi:CheR family methyltransferase [Carboxylicivirga linearis]|uniref:Protein-glutamate O-methyltransferase CheR n=1 Tax=Carboxylicivirga linearis TaxID=1628157 RepID=A0ABS5JQS7_9BACT|nr:CheR family methyltransferase [Carboxylicivirga linearis]MBS2096826.1 protein-glutamate O-methyltransferase CheR [Carboxylicivirga linearis]
MVGETAFREYLNELKKHTPYDFSEYSDNSIHRRIRKILKDYDLTMQQLLERTKTDEDFVEKVVEEITVNTTELFRDPEIWTNIYDKIFAGVKSKKTINIWHAGCSSGMEVYSNLIIMSELGLLDRIKVYGTDINARMVRQAKSGKYALKFNLEQLQAFNKSLKKKPIQGISEIDFTKYFEFHEEEDVLIVKDFLRKVPWFVKHDLVQEEIPFYNKFDIVFCRNVLIYFNASLQSKLFKRFHDQMYPGAFLLLGNHENMSGFYKTKFSKNGPLFVKNNSFHFKY